MLCVAQLVVVLDNTVLTVAVPVLTTELGASTAEVQWMINAYALVLSGLLLTAGSAADRYGRRRMLLAGLVLFGVGSLAAGLASTSGQLIAARAGMGVGGALLVTATLAVAMQVFDAAERSRAIGIWAATSALGFAIGPPIGGTILAHLPWGAIFLINVPIVLVCLVVGRALVPESRGPGRRPTRRARRGALHGRPDRCRLGDHLRARARVGVDRGARRGGCRRTAARDLRAVGATDRAPHAGHALLPGPALRRCDLRASC